MVIQLAVSISVIVPAYNRPDFLGKLVGALKKQTLGKEDFEVLIVYGYSKEVHELCNGIKEDNFLCFGIDSESPSKKRNAGIKKANASIIAFTDDDCVPDSDWLEKILTRFGKEKDIAGVEGLTYTKKEKGLYTNAPENLEGSLFPTCNIAYKKSVLEKIGGFDEDYHFFREDSDLAFRAMELGKIVFSKEARVFHPQRKVPLLRPIETVFLLKEDVRLRKKQPKKYRQYLLQSREKEILKAGLFAIAVILIIAMGYIDGLFGLFIGILCYFGAGLFLIGAEKKANVLEKIIFLTMLLIRPFIFFPLLIYYEAVIK